MGVCVSELHSACVRLTDKAISKQCIIPIQSKHSLIHILKYEGWMNAEELAEAEGDREGRGETA